MLQRIVNEQGQKAYQRTDNEDRSLPYRNWLRTVPTNGFFIDVDFIKWRFVEGQPIPVAITDLTRCDSDIVGKPYLDAILKRFFVRDSQGLILQTLGALLNIPVYLVLFQKDMKWIQVYSFQSKVWQVFIPKDWGKFLNTL